MNTRGSLLALLVAGFWFCAGQLACGSSASDAGGDTDAAAEGPGDSSTDSRIGEDAGRDADADADAGPVMDLTDPPQVVNPTAGRVLTTPRVQLIAYAEDPLVPDVEAMLTELAATTTWSQQTSEYGVGPLTVRPSILLPGAPGKLDDNAGTPTPFQATLAGNLTGAAPAWGAADPSTIYMFVLPSGTQLSAGGHCCSDFYGYHDEAPVGSGSVAYAIACNCADPKLTPLQVVTTTVNHELAEAATNPFVNSQPAFYGVDDAHTVWNSGSSGGEIADMCQDQSDANYTPPGATYTIQRSWSNLAARVGTNPCVPVPATGPYFNSYPTLSDTVSLLDPDSNPVKTEGVKIPIGQTKTIDVVLKSDGATAGPWTVTVQDLSTYMGGSAAALDVSLDKSTGSDGDVLHLTIKVLQADSSLGGEGFVLSSTLGAQNNLWFGAVGQ